MALNEAPNSDSVEDESLEGSARNARYGLILFAVYVLLYGGFVGLSAANPKWMAQTLVGGVNLAIGYGIGLIVSALLLAFFYMYLCRSVGRKEGKAP